MTIEEVILECNKISKNEEQLMKRCDDASGYTRSHNESIRTTDAKMYEIRAEKYRQLAECLKEIKSLKEKDEPKAVRYEVDGNADGAMVYDVAFCPSCNHEFEEDSENWECEYCPNCGQRLRWEE